ncbi:inositol monophosphatase [bacterium]|nr:inositol monophosphatase [bacterium]
MNLDQILSQTADLARITGQWIASEQQRFSEQRVETKELNSLVSDVDRTAERRLVEGLSELLPEAGFITEEETVRNERKPWSWVIDPLDGTTNFIHGLPIYAVSIGLLHGDQIVLGVVYECGRDECFTALRGGGAFCNGQPIRVSGKATLADSLFATGFPYRDYGRMDAFVALLTDFFQGSRGLRRLGSAATDLAWVACGRFDGFFEYGLSPWDVAAGSLLVEEAGGQVREFDGGLDFLFGQTLIASGTELFEVFRATVQQRMVGS